MKIRSLKLFISIVLIVSCLALTACSKEEVQDNKCPKLGEQAPGFSLNTLEGQSVSLQDYLGKTVILNFWQTTCTYCRFQMPFLQEIYDKYSGSGLAVLVVNVAEKEDRVKPYIDENGYTFTVLLDKEAKVNIMYCVPGYPATLFIDPDGLIRDANLGAFQSTGEIEQYLKNMQ